MISTHGVMVIPLKDRVAAEVRVFMARHKISQTALAPLLGWTQQYLSRRLTGKVAFDVNDLDQLSRAFDVPVEQFFVEADVHKIARGARNIIYTLLRPLGVAA